MDISTIERKMDEPQTNEASERRKSRPLTTQFSTTSSTWQPPLDPSSNEIIQQIRELNKDVDTSIQFVRGVNDIICATIPVNFVLVLIALYNVGEIFTGMKYLEDCPLEQRIPVFLLVAGCIGLLKVLHMLSVNIRLRKHSSFTSDKTVLDRDQRSSDIVDTTLNLFLFIWQIVGSYWTLSIWYPKFDPPLYQPNEWCSMHAYLFAVVQIACFGSLVIIVSLFYFSVYLYHRYTNLISNY